MKDLTIFNVASAMARHASHRHHVISQNVANADTPGFKAKDLPVFDARAAAAQTSQGDRSLMLLRMMQANEIENAQASPNGNTVSVEDQIARAADAQAQHDTAMAIYRKSLELLRLSMSARR